MSDPVFTNAFYFLNSQPDGAGEGGPDVDTGDPVAAEGISFAPVNGALEMAQTWERLDG